MTMAHAKVVGGGQYLHPDCPVLDEIVDRFKMRNPEYGRAQSLIRSGKYVDLPEEYIYAARELPYSHPWAGGLQVPRCVDLRSYGFENHVRTSYPAARKVNLEPHIKLRDYQYLAIKKFVEVDSHARDAVVVAPCGAGKTTIGIGTIAAVSSPALVLVHTLDLATQWVTRCRQQLGEEALLIGGGNSSSKKDWDSQEKDARIVVATFQTMYKWTWEERYNFGKHFGLVIVDEAHHVPANTFTEILMTLGARFRLGLTATPERADGLTNMLHWSLGEIIHEVTTPELIERGLVLAPRVVNLNTGWKPPQKEMEYTKMISAMCGNEDRTQLILDTARRAVNNGRQVLVLSDRVQHCIDMAEKMSSVCISAALVGKVSKKKREEILKKADEGEIRALFATTVADEGLDLPGLDTVILTSPSSAMGRIQQRIGRIMRTKEGKQEPLVIDLVDDGGRFYGAAKKRRRLYSSLGCKMGVS